MDRHQPCQLDWRNDHFHLQSGVTCGPFEIGENRSMGWLLSSLYLLSGVSTTVLSVPKEATTMDKQPFGVQFV